MKKYCNKNIKNNYLINLDVEISEVIYLDSKNRIIKNKI